VAPAVVLLNRVLRVRDHPALAEAASRASDEVVPLFVFDRVILRAFDAPNRVAFLLDALADLDRSLGRLGGGLVVRHGDSAEEARRVARDVGATSIHTSADASATARRRERRLGGELHAGVFAVPPGELAPDGSDHYRVFTPFWRRWREQALRPVEDAPARLRLPDGLERGRLPALGELVARSPSPDLPRGGETAGRERLAAWGGPAGYGERRDDLAADATSRLSPYLHLGCVSPRELVADLAGQPGAEPFLRQLAWRDFAGQLLAANPGLPHESLRSGRDAWRDDPDGLAAWTEGRTGYPLVDAGMRQLRLEGWMPNRARLVTASFLVKDLAIDWRAGAAHFEAWLVDGDLASNRVNWQWVAGTGVDPRPERVLNPTRQAQRFDPDGAYVRRWVPELAELEGSAVHEPWRLGLEAPPDYPPPVVDHLEAVRRLRSS
jgi:deoxyribodipyrimidine photo-lyase